MSDSLLDYGFRFLNTPYRYGAKGPNSFDCSGFTSFVYRHFGYSLGADSREQAKQFASVKKESLQKGDLVFFEGRRQNGVVGHAGIVSKVKPNGEFEFLHASVDRGVTISSSEQPYYASRFVQGGRVFDFPTASDVSMTARTEARNESKITENSSVKTPPNETDENTHNNFNAHYHTVQRGETLRSIAKKYDLPVTTLKRLNSLESNRINRGDKLLVNEPIHIENSAEVATETPYEEQKQESPRIETPTAITTVAETSKSESPENIVEQKMKPISTPSVANGIKHRVRAGESLYAIANKYKVTVEQLKQWNNLSTNGISAGVELTIAAITAVPAGRPLEVDKLRAFREALQGTPIPTPAAEPIEPVQPVEIVQVAEPAAPAASPAKQITHTVKRGETLFTIAKQHHTTIEDLKALNKLSSNALTAGLKLKVNSVPSANTNNPEAKTIAQATSGEKELKKQSKAASKTEHHTVKKGESLYSISRKYSCTPDQLKKWNGLSDKASLPIGKKLVIRKS